MPKLRCVCDYIIPLGEIPSPNQYMMISDVELENYTSYTDAEQFYMDLYKEMKIVVHCSNCGRLHIFYDGFDKAQVIYKLDVENNS